MSHHRRLSFTWTSPFTTAVVLLFSITLTDSHESGVCPLSGSNSLAGLEVLLSVAAASLKKTFILGPVTTGRAGSLLMDFYSVGKANSPFTGLAFAWVLLHMWLCCWLRCGASERKGSTVKTIHKCYFRQTQNNQQVNKQVNDCNNTKCSAKNKIKRSRYTHILMINKKEGKQERCKRQYTSARI